MRRKYDPCKGLYQLRKIIKEISVYYPEGLTEHDFFFELKWRGYNPGYLLSRLNKLGLERGSSGKIFLKGP